MKRLVVTLSLRDTRKGEARIDDNRDLDSAGSWTASNEWTSVGFEPQDEDDKERMENTLEELQMTLTGLEYCIDLR